MNNMRPRASKMDFDVIICFEIHAELKTQTKLFCTCPTKPGAPPNTQVCPVCTGHPGTLPVLNKKAVEQCIKAGLALNCSIRERAKFARKNYFYPDLPKGYQISQYEEPLCEEGFIEITGDDGEPYQVGIKRIHLEEDAGKLMHFSRSGTQGAGPGEAAEYSLVDFNRAGIPLIEIVADHTRNPVRSVEEARRYLEAVRQVLRYIDASDCIIEEGQFRCDVNISLRPKGSQGFNDRVEIKNMASFKAVMAALEYEIRRQSEILATGGTVAQETRLFDEEKQVTLLMRTKEDAPDYRYFPEPDLVELDISRELVEKIARDMPELPSVKAQRFVTTYGITKADALLLTRERELSHYFEAAAKHCEDKKRLTIWTIKELFRLLNESKIAIEECLVPPEHFGRLVQLIASGEITEKIGRVVLKEMFETALSSGSPGKGPEEIIEERGLKPIVDERELEQLVVEAIEAHPDAARKIQEGSPEPVNFLIGQIMKRTNGRAHAGKLRQIISAKFSL